MWFRYIQTERDMEHWDKDLALISCTPLCLYCWNLFSQWVICNPCITFEITRGKKKSVSSIKRHNLFKVLIIQHLPKLLPLHQPYYLTSHLEDSVPSYLVSLLPLSSFASNLGAHSLINFCAPQISQIQTNMKHLQLTFSKISLYIKMSVSCLAWDFKRYNRKTNCILSNTVYIILTIFKLFTHL